MRKILFVITQFYKGGAEVALLNLLKSLPENKYDIDFLIFDQMILENAESLIPQIPDWVNVCNAAEQEGRWAVVRKVWYKIYRKVTKHQLYRKSAYDFVKNKRYDVAFSYGEWMAPEFVAKVVRAKAKYVWIHADIDKANYVDPKILLGYDKSYKGYIFVSKHSMESAIRAYPILKGKSWIVHNMCDDDAIRNQSAEKIKKKLPAKPWLVSVANLREEKNYPRMVETMNALKQREVPVTWLCIGSTANPFLYKKVSSLIKQYRLEKDFLLLGVDANPYKYMARAEAVVVLSDHESWSLVITEAKLLGIPVIATKTSGAMEQIEDEKNGLLVSFEPEQIAEQIENILRDKALLAGMRENLRGFSTNKKTLEEFYAVIGE